MIQKMLVGVVDESTPRKLEQKEVTNEYFAVP